MTDKPRIYIAGPMRGYAQFNFPAFDAARDALNELGYEAVSPADLDRAAGFDETATDTTTVSDEQLRAAIARDCVAICSCNAIALLPGWEDSGGVKVELTLTRFLGIIEFRLDTFLSLSQDARDCLVSWKVPS